MRSILNIAIKLALIILIVGVFGFFVSTYMGASIQKLNDEYFEDSDYFFSGEILRVEEGGGTKVAVLCSIDSIYYIPPKQFEINRFFSGRFNLEDSLLYFGDFIKKTIMSKKVWILLFVLLAVSLYTKYVQYFTEKDSGIYSGIVVSKAACIRGMSSLEIDNYKGKDFFIGGYSSSYNSDLKYFCRTVKKGDKITINFDTEQISIERGGRPLKWELYSSISRIYSK